MGTAPFAVPPLVCELLRRRRPAGAVPVAVLLAAHETLAAGGPPGTLKVAALASWAHVDRKEVRRALRGLVAAGFLLERGPGARGAQQYALRGVAA